MSKRIQLLFLLLFIGFTSNAQLIINEFSQGNQGTREYMELLVVGTRTCTDSTADLRGWLVDDNSGWFGTAGIASGHIRFKNVANWAAVPYGSIILIYNPADKNTSITQADDPTDANNDYVYIVPIQSSNTYIETNTSEPSSSPVNPLYTYPAATVITGYSSASNNWTVLGLANTGDAMLTISPTVRGSAFHSVAYGTLSGASQTASVILGAVAAQDNAYLTNSSYNSSAAWTVGSVPANETPGVPNTPANLAWITGMRVQVLPPAPSTFPAAVCAGQTYMFGDTARSLAGSYTHRFTSVGGCDSIVTLVLTVNPQPVITGVTPTNPTCLGNNGSLALNGLTANITYTVGYTRSGTPTTGLILTASASGVLTIPNLISGTYTSITVTLGLCTATNAGPYVLSNTGTPAQPVPTSNSPVCEGGTLSLSTATVTGGTYLWNGPNGFTSTSATPSIPNVTTAATGTYSVVITVSGCPSPAGTTAVTINPLPAKPTATSGSPFCEGGTITLFASTVAGASYSWTGPGGFTANTQNPTRTGATVAMSGYYKVTATIGSCVSLPDSVLVTVNARPATPAITGNSPVCTGDTIKLAVTSPLTGATYTWSGPNSYTAMAPNVSIVASAATAGTYSVTATLNGCTSVTPATINIVVNPRPVITGTSPSNPTTCSGINGSITMNGLTSGTTYTITYTRNGAPQTASITAGAAGSLVLSGLTAGTYNITGVTASGCTSLPVGSFTLTDPAAPAAPTASSNSPVCEGGTLQLNVSGVSGATFLWNGPLSFTSTSASPSIPNVTTAANGNYTVTQTLNGCTSPATTIAVIINPRPATPTITGNSPVCSGDTIKLAVTNPVTGVTYNWSGPNSYNATATNVNIVASAATAGTYSVSATLNGCTSSTAGTINVIVNPRPTVTGTSSSNPTTCSGSNGSITLSGLTPGTIYTVTYTKNGAPQTATITANAGGTLVFSGLTSATYVFTSITANGCSAAPVTPITLSDPSATPAPTAASNSPICEGGTLQLTATGAAGATYQWGGPNGFSATSQTPSITNVTTAATGTYNVTQTVNGCTSAAGTVSVTINAKPATPVISGNSPVCSGDTIKLNSSAAAAGVVYAWNGPNGFTSNAQNPVILNATAASGGVYALTLIAPGDCASLPATLNVVVNARPVISQIVSNSPVCSGGTINLQAVTTATGSTFAWTGPNAYTGATQTIQISNATVANGGTYTVKATLNGCTSLPLTTNVVVNLSPVVASVTGTNPSGCGSATGSILLTGLAPNTSYDINYSRSGIPSFVRITSNTGGNVTITNLVAGTYTNIVLTSGICSSAPAGPVTLTDPSAPAAPTAGNNGPICSGATLSLTANTVAGATYNWTGPNGFASTAQNPSITNATTAASGLYTVTVTVGTCASAPGTTTAAVNQTPVNPVVTSNSPVCVGNTLTLNATSATAGTAYSWTGPNSFTSAQQNPSIPNVTAAAGGTYTVTAQLGTCNSQPVTAQVTIVPIPGAPAPATPLVYCQDAPVPPLTAAGTNLRYYSDSTGGTGVAMLTPSTAVAGTFKYYVSQSTNGCEGPRAQIIVTVNPKPAPPVTTTQYNFCQYSIVSQLTATGTNVRWYATATGNTPLSAAPTPNTQVPGTLNFYVSQKPADCESDRIKVTVIVNPKPAPPGVQTPLFLCQNDTVQLTANGQNLLWYLHPTGGGGMPSVVPNTGTVDSFTYYVTQTVNGCESDRSKLQVYVNYKPNGIILASRPFLCAEDTISFTYYGNARVDAVYNWKIPPFSEHISGSGQGPYVVRYDSAGQQYIQLTINNMGCISDVFQIPVEVRPLPNLAFVLKPEGCVDEVVNVALSGITSGIDRYDWNFDNGKIIYSTATGGPYGIRWNTAGTKVVTVIATTKTCGSRPYRDTIEIHPNPDARISRTGNGTVCSGDSVELSVVNEPGSTYSWTPYQFFTDRARMASTVFATPNLSGMIGVSVTSSKGCTSVDSIYLQTKPCCEVYFPNAFSPNGDNHNDVFRAVTVGHHDVATFRIINRWGQVVFESKDERGGWDGTFNGREQDMGTFYYYFKYRCSESGAYLEQKGEFILMR